MVVPGGGAISYERGTPAGCEWDQNDAPPSEDHHENLDMVLLQGPRRGRFLVIEELL